MRVLTDYPERIVTLDYVFVGSGPEDPHVRRFDVQHMRMHQSYGLLKFKQVKTRNDAELLRALFVMVSHEQAVPLEDDEVYLYQIIGLEVQTTDGIVLGRVSDVLETGANDVYVVSSPERGEILLPVIPTTILETDIERGVITVQIPEGLIPD